MLGRYLAGIRRVTGASHDVEILPQFGDVATARGRAVTHKGVVQASWSISPNPRMDVVIPENMTALAGLPCQAAAPLMVDGRPCDSAHVVERYNLSYRCTRLGAGRHTLACRQ